MMPAWTASFLHRPEWRLPPSLTVVQGPWRKLGQAWRDAHNPRPFNPGWARVRWNPRFLQVDAVLTGSNAANRARRLNERTWELGEVCELFIEGPGRNRYVEIHVTPENHRLQLRWTPATFTAFRRGRAGLRRSTVADCRWVRSRTWVGSDSWAVSLIVPATVLRNRGRPLGAGAPVRLAVCRYDCGGKTTVYSSTARLRQPSYHRRSEWNRVWLASPSAPCTRRRPEG